MGSRGPHGVRQIPLGPPRSWQRDEHGALSIEELRGCGLTDRQIKRAGWLHRVQVGVYAVAHPNLVDPRAGQAGLVDEVEDNVLECAPGGCWSVFQEGGEPGGAASALGNRYVPDFRWPDRRLIREADGARWHEP